MDAHIQETKMINYTHPSIMGVVEERGWGKLDDEEKVKQIYNFVRDEIKFGYNASDDLPASEVLKDGYGQCNTKGTLFMALLRAVGIHCRIHGAKVDKLMQKGAITGLFYLMAPAKIIHVWVEVQLQGKWISLEGIIIDKDYLRSVQALFGNPCGSFYSHAIATSKIEDPQIEWTGKDTRIQQDSIVEDLGVYQSPDDFYTKNGVNGSAVGRMLWKYWGRHSINRNVTRIRNLLPK